MATPPSQPQPPASSTHPNRREAVQSAAEAARTALCPCRVTLATRPQFPHPESEARPTWPPPPGLWARDSRSPSSWETTALSPRGSPPLPRVATPAPSAPTRATCDLGDERFRHQRHGGCEALDARLRSAALGSLPRDLGGSHAVHEPRWSTFGHAETTSPDAAQPARLPPGRPKTSGVADSAAVLPAAPPRALRTRVSSGRSAAELSLAT